MTPEEMQVWCSEYTKTYDGQIPPMRDFGVGREDRVILAVGPERGWEVCMARQRKLLEVIGPFKPACGASGSAKWSPLLTHNAPTRMCINTVAKASQG